MRRFLFLIPLALVALVSCGNLIIAGPERVTFALVIDDLALDGLQVYADVHDGGFEGAVVEHVDAAFEPVPNTPNAVWARMTTLEELPTGQRYTLPFWIDVNDDDTPNSGDLEGVAVFNVMPNAVHSETNYFSVGLTPIS